MIILAWSRRLQVSNEKAGLTKILGFQSTLDLLEKLTLIIKSTSILPRRMASDSAFFFFF